MAKRVLLVFLMVSVFVTVANAGGFALSGVGSKAIAMGGAFRGLADNWSAAYWNPAGLAQLDQTELNFMLIAINPLPEMNANITYGGYDVGYKNGEWRYPDSKTHMAPNFSAFMKMPSRDDITFGMAVFAPYALGSKWNIFSPAYSDAVEEYPEWDHEATLKVIDFHPSIAKSFFDGKLMLGAGMSIYNGDIDFQKALLMETSLPKPHDNLAVDAFLTGDGWGYGGNFGMLYKLSEKLQVGISGKTSATLKLEGDVTNTLYAIANDPLQETLLEQAFTGADSTLLEYIFSTSSDGAREWNSKAKADIKLPADIGIGFAYEATEKFTMTFDISYTMWSTLDEIVIEIDTSTSTGDSPPSGSSDELVINTQWEDILRVSVGGLYRVMDPLEMRFGFFYDPSPIPDETFSPLFLDIGDKYSFNIGSALKLSNVEIGYNFEYILFGSRDIEPDLSAGNDFDNYPGSYEASIIANHLSLTYRF